MPYFISDKNPNCSGWAVEKEDGEVMGCHQSKQDAVDQMVAISLAEDMAPGGERVVDLKLPAYIQNAAAKGLEYNAQGLGGDGLVERTIREARLMADGQISEDKVIRANAWGQRHLVDLDASQNSDSNDEGFPGAGAVAFYLWGIDPLDPEPAMTWFARKAQAIKDDQTGSQRTAHAEDVVIVDIDGTLLAGGEGIQKNIDYVNALYEKFFIYIVTGRGDADEDKTIAELADAGVKYDDIEFNEDLSIPTPEYKGNKAADILSEQSVVLAIDNDPAARRAYFDLGIKTLDPKRIKSGDMPMMRGLPENIGLVDKSTIVQMESRDLNENYQWTAHQQALYSELEDIAETFGQFDQTSGGDGAHYFTENPFKAEGLMCANCAFYDGAQACDLVSGVILPEALCKFWIIPADLITSGRSVPVQVLKRRLDLLETQI
jgi:hypothetical protein